MRVQGILEQVETYVARTSAAADASAAATVVYVHSVTPLLTEAGTVTVDINGDEYTATPTPDDVAPYITVSPALVGAVSEDDPVTVVPGASVKWATVSFPGGDDMGLPLDYRVPLNMVALAQFADGPKNDDERVAVVVDTDPTPVVVSVPNGPTTHDVGTTPLILRNDDGEVVRIDAAGQTFSTNDPLAQAFAEVTDVIDVAYDASSLWLLESTSATQSDPATGMSTAPPFTVASGGIAIESNGTHVFIATATHLRKYAIGTGVEVVTGGWPLSLAGIVDICTDNTSIILSTATQIRKFAISNAAETSGGGWPIARTGVTSLDTDGADIYAVAAPSLHKYAVSNGAAAGGAWPLAVGLASRVALGPSSRVLVVEVGALYEYTAAGDSVGSWATAAPLTGGVAAGDDWFAFTGSEAVYISTYFGTVSTAVSIDSSTGAAILHDLTLMGPSRFYGAITALEAAIALISGQTSVPLLGHSDQKILSASANPTSTTNVNMTSLNMSVTTKSTSDVVWVEIDAEIATAVANSLNTIELLIGGSAESVQLRTRLQSVNDRYSGHKKWRITGLAAGTHTIAFRTRNSAAATDVTIVADHTVASYWTST